MKRGQAIYKFPDGFLGRALAVCGCRIIFLGAACLSFTPLPLLAQQADRFGDWELSCPEAMEAGKSPCRLKQQLAVKESGQTVFALTLLPGDRKNELVGIVSIPLGGYIAPGIELRIDGKKAYKLLVETCNAGGCHAGFPVSAQLQKELSAGRKAVFRVWTTKAKPTDISLSLAETSKALSALRDRSGK